MNEVKVDKLELRKIVQENRDKHAAIFVEAQVKYRERIIEELDRRLADAKSGRQIDVYIALPVPEDHTDDYNRVLRMIDLSVDDTLMLEETDIACYVQDDWAWKRAWFANTASYVQGR